MEPLEQAFKLVVMMRSRTWRQPAEKTPAAEPVKETIKPTKDTLEP